MWEWLKTASEIASFVPGPVGMVASGVRAGMALAEGDTGGAAVYAVGAVPGGKLFKVVRGAEKVVDAGRALDKVGDASRVIVGAAKPTGGGGPRGLGAILSGGGKGVTGYTRHGLNQAIGRNGGRGVSARGILGAIKNPKKVTPQANGTTKMVGPRATIIKNPDGKIVTTWGKPRGPQIRPEGTKRPSGSGPAQRKANERGFSYWPGAIR